MLDFSRNLKFVPDLKIHFINSIKFNTDSNTLFLSVTQSNELFSHYYDDDNDFLLLLLLLLWLLRAESSHVLLVVWHLTKYQSLFLWLLQYLISMMISLMAFTKV